MKSSPSPSLTPWLGRGLFLGSLLLYVLTLSPGFFPGASASFVAAHTGVNPFPPLVNHVWGWVIHLASLLPLGPMAVRVHLVGALSCAASVWFLFQIMLRLRQPASFENGLPRGVAGRARLLSALVAALVLATAVPFWMVATRAHPLAFGLMLMLGAFHLLLRYGENGRMGFLNAAVLVYAIGINDFATLVLFLPVFGLLTLYYLHLHGRLRVGVVLRLLGLALLGLAPQFIAAALYMRSDAYEWRMFSHYGQVLWYMWRDQYLLVIRGLPRVGWLTVGVVSLVPWVVVYVLGIGRRSASAGAWLGTAILCALLSVLSGLVLLNAVISPWSMTRDNPLLVTPYVLIAMWTGALAAYWLATLQRPERGIWPRIGQGFAAVLVLALLALGVRNGALAEGRSGRWFAQYAREVVDRLDGRTMLISSGALDDLILLEARARGVPLEIINLRASQQLSYRRYVASLFDEPRYKSLAEVGVQPLLVEWFARGSNVASRVGVLDVADLWMAAGLVGDPHGPLYLGRAPDQAPDADALAAENRAYWASFAEPLSRAQPPEHHPAQTGFRVMAMQSSKAANNLGVLWEELARDEWAAEAYLASRQFDTNNISALVNLHALRQRQGHADAAALEAQLNAITTQEAVKRRLWSLSYHYGTIRSPELYASRGWAWAMSGKPALAAQDMRKALDLGGESSALRLALTALDAAQDGPAATEEFLHAELERDPKNKDALLGLYRIALQRGQFAIARGHLQRLREAGDTADGVQLEEVLLDVLSGQTEKAAAALKDLVAKKPDDLRAWAALAVVAGERKDAQTVRDALDRLQQARRASPAVRFMAAQVAARQGDRAGARAQLDQVLRQQPNHAPALDLMIRLLMAEGDRETAEGYVDRLINAEPNHAFGNYMLGAFQAMRGQYALAESSYRVSLQARRAPEALNDLAYVLARQNRHEEALPIIEECLRASDLNGAAWSTYGIVLLANKRLDEAETALQQALTNNPESPEVQLNLALLYEQKGQGGDALKLAESITPRTGELLRDDQDRLRDLLKRLR